MGTRDCNPLKTPVDPGNHHKKTSDEESALDQQLHQSAIGSLLYLATCTKPDTVLAVTTLARFQASRTRLIGLPWNEYWGTWKEQWNMESPLMETNLGNVCVIQMLTGLETKMTESLLLDISFRLLVGQFHGRVKSKTLWLCLLWKWNTWLCPVLLKRQCGWEDSTQTWETCKRDLPSSMRTIYLPSQCPETHNSMGEQNILIYVTTLLESKWVMEWRHIDQGTSTAVFCFLCEKVGIGPLNT